MSEPVSDLAELLRTLRPVLNDGNYVFAVLPHDAEISALEPLATFRENEGVTVVVEEERAQLAGLRVLFRAACPQRSTERPVFLSTLAQFPILPDRS